MRLTLIEKKIVKRLAEHGLELIDQDMVAYHRGRKREEVRMLKKNLNSIIVKVTKDLETEEDK